MTWGLVTYDANGIRPLAAAEYATGTTTTTGLTAGTTTNNVRDSFAGGTVTLTGPLAANAYVLDNNVSTGALTANLTGTLTLGSGTLVLTNTTASGTNNYQATSLLGGNITLGATGAAEGNIFVMTPAGATISSTITGSNGLTVSGNGQLTLSGVNTTTLTGGPITVNGTTLNIAADTALGAATNGVQFGGGLIRFNSAGQTLAATRTVTLAASSSVALILAEPAPPLLRK